MAIDILTRKFQVPIVVGDLSDMKDYCRSVFYEASNQAGLILSDGKESSQRLPISPSAADNIRGGEYVLLVALNEADEIAHAYLSPLDDDVTPVRRLSEPEIKRVAENLVSGDFNLDFLR